MRLTQTVMPQRDTLFKHKRCRLHGWKLHADDKERLENCSTPQMKRKHIPDALYLRRSTEKLSSSGESGYQVVEIKPAIVIWYLDKECQVGVKRKGFTVAPNLSGTAHSFAGESLSAAFVDCFPWDVQPDQSKQLAAYMSFSRLSHVDDLFLLQAYAPGMLEQGELQGPDLLLRFHRGDLRMEDLQTDWGAQKRSKSRKREDWPESMLLLCRGCPDDAGRDIRLPLRAFAKHTGPRAWDEVVSLGMERFCKKCLSSTEQLQDHVVSATARACASPACVCAWCQASLPQPGPVMLTPAHMFCKTCQALTLECAPCSRLAHQDIVLPIMSFSLQRLRAWKAQRDLSRSARCLDCDQNAGNAVKQYRWQQTLYECSQCRSILPPRNFHMANLRRLEEDASVELAVCNSCTMSAVDMDSMTHICNHCKLQKSMAAPLL